MPGSTWFVSLRELRSAAGLSRRELGARAALSEESLRAYETGRRHPSRESLTAILDALHIDPLHRNEVLEGAGYAADDRIAGGPAETPDYSLAEAKAEIDGYPWPACINSELFEVLEANALFEAVVGLKLAGRNGPMERNMVVTLSSPRWADCIVNWDEAMQMTAEIVKGSYSEIAVSPDGPNPYVASIMQHFLSGDPKYVQRFLRIWAEAEPRPRKWRFWFPLHWQHPDVGLLKFKVMVNPGNFSDYFTFVDWMPVDSETWSRLELLRRT
ncbi:MAG TPA: helix-turn-helix domain-containing protein [Tepidiformaceae bacterium]|nr:helix-turn-helix domain-containing protein [Tepidiformaceae bacterium]